MAGSPLLGLLAGLAQIPKLTQERKDVQAQRQFTQADNQAKLAQDQAAVQGQQIANQSAQMTLQSLKMKRGYEMADMFHQQAIANPKLAADPKFLAQVQQQVGGMGVQVPLKPGPNGTQSIDFDAMRQRPAFDDAGIKMIQSTPDPVARQAIISQYDPATVPPDVMNIKFEPPITPGSETATLNGFNKQFSALQNGAPVGPFLTYVRANYENLKALMPPDPQKNWTGVDAFFDPAWQKDTVSKSVQAKIDYMHHLGIKIDDDEKFKNDQVKIELQKLSQGEERVGILRGELAVRERNADTAQYNAGLAGRKLDLAMRDLNFRMNNAEQQRALQASGMARSGFQSLVTQAATYRDQLNNQLETLKRQYAVTNGQGLISKHDPNDPNGALYQLDPAHNGNEPDPNDPTGKAKLPMSLAAKAEQAQFDLNAAKQQLQDATNNALSIPSGLRTKTVDDPKPSGTAGKTNFGTVVRTGKLPDGRRVRQYSDGKIRDDAGNVIQQ